MEGGNESNVEQMEKTYQNNKRTNKQILIILVFFLAAFIYYDWKGWMIVALIAVLQGIFVVDSYKKTSEDFIIKKLEKDLDKKAKLKKIESLQAELNK